MRTDSGTPTARDSDGDRISDSHEGFDAVPSAVDTDGDGTPDFMDMDSDADGLPDLIEGAGDPALPPPDSDGDGTPDFRDLDSDDSGIPDAEEGDSDTDMDGAGDWRDLDNDGDSLRDADEVGDPASPTDFDMDGLPDYMDVDSDGDGIGDRHEGPAPVDTDRDMTPDRHDADSDGDGLTDMVEAGDSDLLTAPFDSDMDTVPDFRDADSDNDGLSDEDEVMLGTDPTDDDTDGDGVTDLIEIAACGGAPECEDDVLDPMASPRTRGDFVFLEPYMMPPFPPEDTLVFSTDIQVADVYFLIDTTGSMGGAITNVRSSLSRPGGIIEQVRTEIPDTNFGVGGFDDYQVAPYGYATSGDRAYYHLHDISADVPSVQAAVNTMVTHYGGDGPESAFPALNATVTGNGLAGMSGWSGDRSAGFMGFAACPMGHFGWPCFRPGAVPIVVIVTDVQSHNGPGDTALYNDTSIGAPTPRYTAVATAASDANVRVIGVAVSGGGIGDLQRMATDTGAVDAAGMPLVSSAPAGSVDAAVVNHIRTLANQTPIDISLVYEDDMSDAVDSWMAFMDHIEANEAGDAALGCPAQDAQDTDADGFPDTFVDATPGQPVCFDIIVKMNGTVMPTEMPQVFQATLRVLGDGFTELDSREIFFLVPPEIVGPGGPN